MGFYLYFNVLVLSLYLILNIFTAQADALRLTVSHNGIPCNDGTSVCAVVAPYEKHLALTCTSDSPGKTLAWFHEPSVSDKEQSSTGESSAAKPSKEVKSSAVKADERIKIFGSEKLVLNFTSIKVQDEGKYFCQESNKETTATSVEKSQPAEVRVLPYASSGKEVNVIEENQLVLTCTVYSAQPATVEWNITTLQYNTSRLLTDSYDRVELKSANGTKNVELHIKSANSTKDRGTYICSVSNKWGKSHTESVFHVRVKSKYAALWPFLGMCAEVIILCSIIFIYEKKRDKTELEESDTDQGPETKSSPDHGQDSVRYRK